MVNWGGGASGAMSGAQMGSAFGPWGTAIGAGIGGIAGLFGGGGPSEEEKLAMANMQGQMERSNRFWKQAEGNIGQVRNWAAPILGGSRTAAMEAMAPEIQGAAQRMDMGRQSLLSLSSRSGGAGQRIDPYAKGSVATSMLQQARPQAANMMQQIATTKGGWAGQNQGATQNMWQAGNEMYGRDKEKGQAFYKQLNDFADWASNDPTMGKLGGQLKGWMGKIPGLGGQPSAGIQKAAR